MCLLLELELVVCSSGSIAAAIPEFTAKLHC